MEDTELKTRFDSIDSDLKAADSRFNRVDARFDKVDARFSEVDARFDKVDARFSEIDARFDKVDARFSEIDARFDKVDARFSEIDARFDKVDARFMQVDARFNEMQQLILQEGERTRQHFDVVAEGLKDGIRLIAEGYTALREDNAEVKTRLQRVEDGQERLEVHVLAIESRVTGVEKTQKIVLTEVRGLATKVDRLTRVRRPGRTNP